MSGEVQAAEAIVYTGATGIITANSANVFAVRNLPAAVVENTVFNVTIQFTAADGEFKVLVASNSWLYH